MNPINELVEEVLKGECIYPVYQPIVSLKNGMIYGYEALSRITLSNCHLSIDELFEVAMRANKLWELEMLCRTQALKGAHQKPARIKLFLNVDPNIIYDSEYISGFTKEKLLSLGFNSEEIIFEITEKSSIDSPDVFTKALDHYQSQGFKVAVDDFGIGYSGLMRVCSFSPNFIKLDMSIVRGINQDSKKRSVVLGIVKFCREAGIQIIAEGIETKEELTTLIDLDVDYGQGYFIAHPDREFQKLSEGVEVMIRQSCQRNQSPLPLLPGLETVGFICKRNDTVTPDTKALSVYEEMRHNPSITEVCVTDEEGNVHGILTRNYLLGCFSGQYGYGLNCRRNVGELLTQEYMTVDSGTTVEEIANTAMDRDFASVYDAVIVTEQGKYFGVVTVRDLLLAAINMREKRASDASPLTGLPGNNSIQLVIDSVIRESEPYAIMYLDLDNFKAYNDAYGFPNGDSMLKTLAQALVHCCSEKDFIGHIGGDDFVVVTRHRDIESIQKLCDNIINTFFNLIQPLYSSLDWERGYIVSKDRNGFTDNFPITTLSIAVVTNKDNVFSESSALSKTIAEVKKKCKQQRGNAVIIV
ncbi:MAG: GGDEF domain-containing protein [Ruminococcaceae bacterium]|nr:GGDEF domain-containing protein [Oscillospiraceae bacterium]